MALKPTIYLFKDTSLYAYYSLVEQLFFLVLFFFLYAFGNNSFPWSFYQPRQLKYSRIPFHGSPADPQWFCLTGLKVLFHWKEFTGICLSFIMLEAGDTPEIVTSFHFQCTSSFLVDEFLLLVHKGSIFLMYYINKYV